MTRRNAFNRMRENPQDPINSIPPAQGRRREDRTWDREHRGRSYFIPTHLEEQGKDVRALILSLAQKHMSNTSNVATALMSFSLAQVRQGKLVIEARPDAGRRKMTLTWEETKEWPQEIPPPRQRTKKEKKDIYLNYRWSGDVDRQIKALAGDAIPVGEVVLYLLAHALTAHKNGRLRLKEEAIVMGQTVRSTW